MQLSSLSVYLFTNRKGKFQFLSYWHFCTTNRTVMVNKYMYFLILKWPIVFFEELAVSLNLIISSARSK